MARDRSNILRAVKGELDLLDLELDELRARQLRAVVTKTATGTGDIANTFELDRKFRLVFIRCHFSGTSGTAAFVLSSDSVGGSAYDTREPSAWTFQTGDSIRIDWTSPDSGNITWGIEVGLVLAS